MSEIKTLENLCTRIEIDFLIYSLHEEENTAQIVGNNISSNVDLIIPRSIKYKTRYYIITSISSEAFRFSMVKSVKFAPDSAIQTFEEDAFSKSEIESFQIPSSLKKICRWSFFYCTNLKVIEIPPDSELKTIEKGSFCNSKIESLTIPSSTVELESGWSIGVPYLNKIIISPNNPRYSLYDDKMIIGKSSLESKNFDVIVYCIKSAKTIEIPSFIKTIGSYAFYECENLQQIEIPTNSELETIEKYAFSYTSIEKFTIPPHLTKICKGAFSGCINFLKIEIQGNSKLKTIEEYAFTNSSIESLQIPTSTIELDDKWCIGISKLNKIILNPNNPRYSFYNDKMIIGKSTLESQSFDVLVFCIRNVKEITIPEFVKFIGSYALDSTKDLQKVEIPTNSKLLIIGQNAFSYSSICSFSLFPNVTEIGECAFICCRKLVNIEIPSNSQLKKIGKDAFSYTSIKNFTFSSHIEQVDDLALSHCYQLQIVEIDENSELKFMNMNVFESCIQPILMIPTKLRNQIKFLSKNLI